MSLQIVITDDAVADAMQIADHLAEQAGLDTSDKFLNATTRTYRLLAAMPGVGVQRSYNNPRLTGMRMFPVSGFRRYLVFYQAGVAELTILRVLDGRQNVEAFFDRPEH